MGKQPLSEFNYLLPLEKIAQFPNEIRGQSKLLVVDRRKGSFKDASYQNLIDYIPTGDVVVLNDVKVIPARLYGHAPGRKGTVEVLLLRKTELPDEWEALIGHKQRLGGSKEIIIAGQPVPMVGFFEDGRAILRSPELSRLSTLYGHIPLPKYIKREDTELDRQRYQTVFAHKPGAVAAPTASLNLTTKMIEKLTQKGVQVVYVTLFVGLGTFAPVRTTFIEDHQIHTEYAEVPAQTAATITQAKQQGRAVWAIGTTVTRTLEGIAQPNGSVKPFIGDIQIYIHPPFSFKVVDHLVTNFHAPKTTVLILAATFAGQELLFKAYHHALKSDYRFLSYGDSMLIL